MVRNVTRDNLKTAVTKIETAITENPLCSAGLFAQSKSFAIERGPFGGAELLALIYADDLTTEYWYGHLLWSKEAGCYVSLLIGSKILINAKTVPLLFLRFHYWMVVRNEYSPCYIQNDDDVFAAVPHFNLAVSKLEIMISKFDLEKRNADEFGPFGDSQMDNRVIGVYGLNALALGKGDNYSFPPVPTEINYRPLSSTEPILRLVKDDL